MRRVCEGPDGGEAQAVGHAHTPCRASAGSNGRAEPDEDRQNKRVGSS
jgi:hypothetical protein